MQERLAKERHGSECKKSGMAGGLNSSSSCGLAVIEDKDCQEDALNHGAKPGAQEEDDESLRTLPTVQIPESPSKASTISLLGNVSER